MRSLGAYFANQYNQPIHGLGAYYPTTENWRIGQGQDSLGQVPQPVSFAEQELESLLQTQSPGQLVTPWANREGDVDWSPVNTPRESYRVYPLSDALLAKAAGAAFEHEANWVGILAPKAVPLAAVEQALQGRSYSLHSTEGVYRQADAQPVPVPLVLYWLALRDDPYDPHAGRGSLDAAAKQLGGQLVFMMPEAHTGSERAHPDVPFVTALTATSPVVQAQAAQQAAQLPAAAPAQAAGMPRWLVLAGVAGLGYLGWRWWKGRKGG